MTDFSKKHFTVYFEIYSKKMKATVEADNKFHAQSIVEKKLKIIKIVDDPMNDAIQMMKDLFTKR